MTLLETAKERWSGTISTVTLGADAEAGGTRKSVVKIGGAGGLPFAPFDGTPQHRVAVAMEVWDCPPDDWPDALKDALGDVAASPVEWAKACVDKWGADLIYLRLTSTHPDQGDASPKKRPPPSKPCWKPWTCP